ncbi:hydrogenase nickel incorporation protein HypB [Bradyrhizobium sp. NAS96.2]|uniref:hydrogenase nickel incorporation protein HypB n=1 Tax=Bradyrhizobium sp. NAS96.2 TaxID=1680160 RepID=UPI00093A302F|nr:hydrogenase nickel incorporation protein HypB [Bradyrhizobium sp. NAS96.2]OKO77064.1 hydrogenase nickel incorporation protein HypB [Bradyrhizobium sp. NAS96.2]
MCSICGCSEGVPSTERTHAQGAHANGHRHAHGHDLDHVHTGQGVHHSHRPHRRRHHDHNHQRAHGGRALLDCAADPAGLTVAGMSSERVIQIGRDILGRNDRIAADNRARFLADDMLVFNLVSSPGAGKTSLLVRAVSELKRSWQLGVIEGDQQTSNDAERIRATGVPAIQINTGKGCHLDATMVSEAYRRLPPLNHGILFIENVGNLVCPAAFDLGEACKIVVLSTTEGEDKPLKYPEMFAASSLMLINKIDLARLVDFDLDQTVEYARRVSPGIEVLTVSARTGEGFAALYAWIGKQVAGQTHPVGGTAR